MSKTKDLTLATTLRVMGHEPLRMELNDDREVVWVFNGCDQIISDYHDWKCQVEPRRYNMMLKKTRDELFKFLRRQGVRSKRASQTPAQ
jgi:hypothetical protein